MTREIRFYEKYFIDFYLKLDPNVQEKIEYVFKVIRTVDRFPQKFLKHIESTDGLYEIRIKVGSDIYINCKKLYPIKRVEVYKTEVISQPTIIIEEKKSKKAAKEKTKDDTKEEIKQDTKDKKKVKKKETDKKEESKEEIKQDTKEKKKVKKKETDKKEEQKEKKPKKTNKVTKKATKSSAKTTTTKKTTKIKKTKPEKTKKS